MAKKKKIKKEKTLEEFLIPKLRRISLQWPARNQAFNKVKLNFQIGFFKNGKPKFKNHWFCEECGIVHPDQELFDADHVRSVVDMTGYKDFNEYVPALFCLVDNFRVLCKPCHKIKSAMETTIRSEMKKHE